MSRRFLVMCCIVTLLWVSIPSFAQACDEFDTASQYARQARQLKDDGLLGDAVDAYTCAIELDPDNIRHLNSRGLLYYDAGEDDLAIADYERVMEIDPTYPHSWNNRALIYYERGELALALEDYTKAIELNSSPVIAYRNRALAYLERGEYILAEEDLLRAIDNDATYERAYLTLAHVYVQMDDKSQSHPYFAGWIDLIATDTIINQILSPIESETYPMVQGRLYEFSFSGIEGQVINIAARANQTQDIDPLLVLLDSSNDAVVSDDDSGINLDAVISNFVLPSTGLYTLQLSHAGAGWTGDVVLTVDLGADDSVIDASAFATFNLFIGEVAEVFTTGGDRLNLRSGPGLDFEIVERLEPASLVTLVEGPRKVDGYAWWRVRDDAGNIGWAVERVEDEQTLQLALLVGEDAVVATGGDKLNVRTEAGTGNDLAFQLDEGTRVTLVEAPTVADGYRWWHIRTEDGQEGWTIDRFDGDRMLIPAKEVE